MANADIVCRDIRMTGKGRTRVARTCGARSGVSLASAERGKAIGDSRNGYRRNALYAALALCDTCGGVLVARAAYPAARLRNASRRYSTAPDSIDSTLPKRSITSFSSSSVMSRSSPVSGSKPTQAMSPKMME